MNADYVKAMTLRNMLYFLSHKAAVTEHCGNGCIGQADVFGINSNDFTYEFEVKISRGDLRGELKAIELCHKIKAEGTLFARDENEKLFNQACKFSKHRTYLDFTPNPLNPHLSVPNYFAFMVLPELAEFAEQGIKDTPYGLYVTTGGGTCVKRPRPLHKEKAGYLTKDAIMKRACVELERLHYKLYLNEKKTV